MHKKNILTVIVILVSLILSYQYFHAVQKKYLQISSFNECVRAGYPVRSTYPEVCAMPGKQFENPNQKKVIRAQVSTTTSANSNYLNQIYIIDGQSIQFKNGIGVASSTPQSKQKTSIMTYTINIKPFSYDVNNDSILDTVILLEGKSVQPTRSVVYIGSSLSNYGGFFSGNTLYVDTTVLNPSFIFKNGEIVLTYNPRNATTTLLGKKFLLEDGILKELSE